MHEGPSVSKAFYCALHERCQQRQLTRNSELASRMNPPVLDFFTDLNLPALPCRTW